MKSKSVKNTDENTTLGYLCRQYIAESLKMAEHLMMLTNSGELLTDGDDCRVLFGVMRDCAYKIRGQAKRELRSHKREKKSEQTERTDEERRIQQIEC